MTTSVPSIPRPVDGGGAAVHPRAGYLRPDRTGFISGWTQPVLRESRHDVRAAWRPVAARAVETIQNSGWMAGAVDQAIADTLGTGLKLNAVPDADALGLSEEEARGLARRIERRWRRWSRRPLECDARGKMTVDMMADAMLRSHYAFGEGAARILRRKRAFAQSATKVQLFSPLRIQHETAEDRGLYQGVFVDGDGLATGYRVKARVGGQERTVDLPARDRDGSPLLVHVFDGAADQTRGISPFAPILKVFRQADQLADATLVTMLLQTIFAATVKSDSLSEEAFDGLKVDEKSGEVSGELGEYLKAKNLWWEGSKLDLGSFGRVNHLFVGEELQFHSTNHPHNNYLPFLRNLLREIARAIGVSYEALSFDYEKATYSSVRMGIASLWPLVTRRRLHLSAPFYQAIYEAWLEEEIFHGWVEFPGGYRAFLKHRAAICQAEWNGPAKPTADDLKSAKSMGERLERGTTSLAHECAEIGLDWEDVAEQRARESERYLQLGQADPHSAKGSPLVGHNGGPVLDEDDDDQKEEA